MSNFRLTDYFLSQYKDKKPPFGFNGLGELVYMRTYSRLKEDGTNEVWWETVERVVNGTFNMQKRWIESRRLGWKPRKAQASAQEMYERIFNMKFLPPGRGLWAMGTVLTEEKKLYAALNNCSFVSTEYLKEDLEEPFTFLMDMSMLGVGVGFDLKGADANLPIKRPKLTSDTFVIPDSREGWVESVGMVIKAWLTGSSLGEFNYSAIRGYGEPIKGFGGTSSGPQPLMDLHEKLHEIFHNELTFGFGVLTQTLITDIMNLIGTCVVAGNVRRTAEIVFGDYNSGEYMNLKNYKENPQREAWGWTSNNSIFADIGMDYSLLVDRIADNGEPGLVWLENMKNYSRMNNGPDYKDIRVAGANPCSEQSLESYELCCLVETFPHNHESLEDYKKTLKYAYLYAKTVTLGETHFPKTNRVMLRNRRIGCSMSGVAQFVTNRGLEELREWMVSGYDVIQEYDKIYSDWLAIPKSIKTTSIKPSGTVSLLAGATPGIHYPESRYYIRRVRISKSSTLVQPLIDAGYHVEDAVDSDNTLVVEVPVALGSDIRTISEVSIWEQVAMAAFAQTYWSDNQVSCTVTFDPKDKDQIAHALNFYQYRLKGISFLPRVEQGAYRQMPYEALSPMAYATESAKITPINFSKTKGEEVVSEKFCDTDVCQIDA